MMGICERMSYNMTEYEPDVLSPLVGLHCVTSLSATLLNLLVIVTIFRSPFLQSPSRILLCSLSLSDFCIGLIAQPTTIIFYVSAFNNSSAMFCISWVIMTRIGYSMGMIAFVTLTAMSLDRYLAITTKAKYKTLVTKTRTTILAICLWIFTPLATITGVQFLARTEKFSVVFAVVVIFLLLIVSSYVSSFYNLKKMSARISHNSSFPTLGNATTYHSIIKYKRSLMTVVMILALNLVVYIPMMILSIVTVLSKVDNSVAVFQYVGFILSFSSTVNPIFYLWRMTDLREAVNTMLRS